MPDFRSPNKTGHLFLLFFFQFSFFLFSKLGLFLLFPFAFVLFPLITHICFSLFESELCRCWYPFLFTLIGHNHRLRSGFDILITTLVILQISLDITRVFRLWITQWQIYKKSAYRKLWTSCLNRQFPNYKGLWTIPTKISGLNGIDSTIISILSFAENDPM